MKEQTRNEDGAANEGIAVILCTAVAIAFWFPLTKFIGRFVLWISDVVNGPLQ